MVEFRQPNRQQPHVAIRAIVKDQVQLAGNVRSVDFLKTRRNVRSWMVYKRIKGQRLITRLDLFSKRLRLMPFHPNPYHSNGPLWAKLDPQLVLLPPRRPDLLQEIAARIDAPLMQSR